MDVKEIYILLQYEADDDPPIVVSVHPSGESARRKMLTFSPPIRQQLEIEGPFVPEE